jgi:hypothetical protein
MTLSLLQVLAIIPVVAACAFIQSAMGFAFGIFAVPALMLLGLSLPQAVALSTGAGFVQTIAAVYQLRQHVPWGITGPSIIVRTTFTLVGIWLLAVGLAPNKALANEVLGIALVGALLVLWLFKVQPRERLHLAWAALAIPSSGLMGGMLGMGGPPLVLWATAHRWTNHQTRAFLLANFLVTGPFQMAGMCFFLGHDEHVPWLLLIGAAFAPAAILGTVGGLYVGHRLSAARLRALALGILAVMAVHAVVSPWLTHGQR